MHVAHGPVMCLQKVFFGFTTPGSQDPIRGLWEIFFFFLNLSEVPIPKLR